MSSSSAAAAAASFPASLLDLQLSPFIGDQQRDLHLTISSTSPPFLLVIGDNTQHIIFSCFHSCNPQQKYKGIRWRCSRFHKEKNGMCPPLPDFQDICSCLSIEKADCCQVPVFSGKPATFSPYYLCSSCLSAGRVRKRQVKTMPAIKGCSHTAPPLELLQWRGLLFDGVEKVSVSLESSSRSHLLVASDQSAASLDSLSSIHLPISSLEVDSLSALPPSLPSSVLTLPICKKRLKVDRDSWILNGFNGEKWTRVTKVGPR
jgi:hypothetical protein